MFKIPKKFLLTSIAIFFHLGIPLNSNMAEKYRQLNDILYTMDMLDENVK